MLKIYTIKNKIQHKEILETPWDSYFEDKRITPDMCDESEITKNNKIVKFEEEAYLKGNIAFRTWTELENNKN